MMMMMVAPRQGRRAHAARSIGAMLLLLVVAMQLHEAAAAAAGKARPAAASSLLHTTKPQQQRQQRPAAKQSNGTAPAPAAAGTHHRHQAATSEAGQLFLLGGLLQPLNALAQWAQAVGSILTGGVLGGGAGQPAELQPPHPATKKTKKKNKHKGGGGESKQPTVASRPTLGVVPMCEWRCAHTQLAGCCHSRLAHLVRAALLSAGRALQIQVPALTTLPGCTANRRADYGACEVHRQWYLTLPGAATPGSYVAQLLTGASARDLACSRLQDPAACLDAPEDLRWGRGLRLMMITTMPRHLVGCECQLSPPPQPHCPAFHLTPCETGAPGR